RLREEPSPADIVYFKRYSVSELDVSGSMSFFRHRSTKPKVTRVCYAPWGGMKRVAKRRLWVPRRDAGVSVAQAIVEGDGGRVGGPINSRNTVGYAALQLEASALGVTLSVAGFRFVPKIPARG
ncbi:MAG TPA: hypothetical protein VFE27_07945, partial [Acidobacteriaceae bacterium]|nr:hypothetical protein [Acidobacteriaceae bacterium]